MASFTGTVSEFKKFIGPRLRNLVQQLTKKHKLQIGQCQTCGTRDSLEAAHVNGKGRGQIIEDVCSDYNNNGIVTVDLEIFESKFRNAHNPLEDSILILCKECHVQYDNEIKIPIKSKVQHNNPRDTNHNRALLPITLEPSDPLAFKDQLLIHKRALIKTVYNDGKEGSKTWNASNFSESSDVLNNLRSRPKFRQGKWQANNIARVSVSIVSN